MEKSGEYLAGAIEVLDRLLSEEQTQSSNKSPFRLFELSFLLVKSHLQHAAILSHLITHDQALRHAQLSKEKVRDCVRLMKLISSQGSRLWERSGLEVMLEKFIHEVTHRDPTSSDYMSPMITGPLFEKRSQSSNSVNRSEQATRSQVDVSADQYASGIIFWKHNQKNNEKYLKQELAKRYGDSFQGKKMNTEWLQLFNIGNIMHVTPVTYRELLSDETDHTTILTEDRLVELVLVYSCCLFSIATENRFICHRELDTDKAATELSGPAKTVAKNYQLLQNHNFKQS